MPRSPILDATAPIPPYTPGENPYILRTESSVPGRSILLVAAPASDSYMKVTSAGGQTLLTSAQVRTDLGISSVTDVQNANTVYAGPASGAPAEPTFRALVAADIPTTLRATTFTSPITLPGETNGNPQIIVGAVGTVGGLINSLDNLYINSVPATGRIVFGRGRSGFTGGVEAMQIRDGVVIGGSTDPGATNLLVVGSTNTASLLTNSTTFNLVNATPTTVNFAGAATALNMGSAASGVTTLNSPTVSLAGTLLQPVTAYNTNIGSLSKKFLSLHAAELFVETLVAQDTMATVGGRVLVGPTTSLIADLSTGATTIDVKHNNLASGDRVYMESSGNVEFMAVTSGATVITGGFRYSVTRNLDGTGANAWFAGDAVFNTGQTGNGFIDLYSARGVKAATEVGPTIVGNVRNSATYNDWSPRWAVGNLRGLYDYGTTIFGAAFGRYATAGQTWAAIDETNGFRVLNNVTPRIWLKADGSGYVANSLIAWDTSGNLTVAGNATIGGFSIGTDYIRDVADSFGLASTVTGGDDVRFWAGNTFANRATAPFRLTEAGALVATSATITGAITASSGSITGTMSVTGAGSFQAAGGNVILDTNGLVIATGSGASNTISWKSGAGVRAQIAANYSAGLVNFDLTSISAAADTTGYSAINFSAINDTGSGAPTINLTAYGSAHATFPNKEAISLLGDSGRFLGVAINGSNPAYMLDVTGDGRFTTNLTIGGALNPAGTPIISGAVATGSTTPNAELRLGRSTSSLIGDVLGQVSFYTSDASSNAAGRQCAIKAITSEASGRMSDLAFFTGNGTEDSSVESMRLTAARNLKLGGTATRATTQGTFHLDIYDGIAPAGTMANGISLYSSAGECRVLDAAGNSTLLSPHDKETNEWIFFSKNTVTGKVLRIDMERMMRALDKKLGGGFIREYMEAA